MRIVINFIDHHVHCVDNYTDFMVLEIETHESSVYAQESMANGLSNFKACALSPCHLAPWLTSHLSSILLPFAFNL